jgi:hypothetical protein
VAAVFFLPMEPAAARLTRRCLLQLRLQPHRLPHLYVMVNGRKITEIAGRARVICSRQILAIFDTFSSRRRLR